MLVQGFKMIANAWKTDKTELNNQIQADSLRVISKLPSYSKVAQWVLILLTFFQLLDQTNCL